LKRIGLLGGMSWESSSEYYRLVNVEVRERLGGLHSADCVLRSVDFAPIEVLQREGRWGEAGERLATEARSLVSAGAELIVLETEDRRLVHQVIYEELCVGIVSERSREQYRRVMRELAARGAEGILFGCTEIDLLVGAGDAPVPVFDTTALHARRAVQLALGH
jgi:aspartate/glutamate racemase